LTWRWDGSKWVAATLATGLYYPNKLVNPFMEIDQANEGAAVTTSANYVVDGVVINVNLGTISAQRSTDAPPGYPNSAIITQTGTAAVVAGSLNGFLRRIEWDELIDTGWGTSSAQTVALAFWAKASIAGTYCGSLNNAAATRSYVFNVVITAANTWQLFSYTIPGDTSGVWAVAPNTTALNLRLTLVVGSTFQTATTNAWVAGNFVASTAISNTMATTLNATFQLGPCGLWVAPAPQPLLRLTI